MAPPQNVRLVPIASLATAVPVAAIIEAATKAVVGQLIKLLPPISATIFGKRVAVISTFIECRRFPPNSTANGRIKRGTRRADQVSGMGAFSSASAFDGATTLRLCIVLPRRLRACYLAKSAGSNGRIARAHETAS